MNSSSKGEDREGVVSGEFYFSIIKYIETWPERICVLVTAIQEAASLLYNQSFSLEN